MKRKAKKPAPLPPCPYCGKAPKRWVNYEVSLFCYAASHELSVAGPTDAVARRRWRKLAGARP